MVSIKIKYLSENIEKLRYIDGKSDWIDLRAAERVELKAGEFHLIPLGIAMELPKGYEVTVGTMTNGFSLHWQCVTPSSNRTTAFVNSAFLNISLLFLLWKKKHWVMMTGVALVPPENSKQQKRAFSMNALFSICFIVLH